jgi:deoxyribose-phosphate aldolase
MGLRRNDIRAVARICSEKKKPLKVIFETCYLTTEEIARTTEICVPRRGYICQDFNGFAAGGATVEAYKTMLDAAKGRISVKPSGGIRDRETAIKYVEMAQNGSH